MERFLSRLENKMGRFYIPGLMKIIVFGMAGVFLLDLFFFRSAVTASQLLSFNRALILRGQVWRLVTFIFIPEGSSPIFIFFTLYFYYLLGTALENRWGSRRFNLYYLLGILGADLGGMLTGYGTGYFLNLSLFLAFACLYPEFEILLFFVLPVKIKYIAYLDAAYLAYLLFSLPWAGRGSMLLSLLPFFLFFGEELFFSAKRLAWRLKNRR
ncbi:MAG: rhomboid family intramembrane serine protease [Clostridia bacterium]|nr:rhomboid family intramembrane serine protease [Clostridia bacterium]